VVSRLKLSVGIDQGEGICASTRMSFKEKKENKLETSLVLETKRCAFVLLAGSF